MRMRALVCALVAAPFAMPAGAQGRGKIGATPLSVDLSAIPMVRKPVLLTCPMLFFDYLE